MDRPIDFNRPRLMRCRSCGYVFEVDWSWLERWEQSNETCPQCGTACESETCARPYPRDDDQALNDGVLREMYWYHSTEVPDWPAEDFNPLATLSSDTIRRLGGRERAEIWASRQKNKALHLGTYEAAVHNMYRRISDQEGAGKIFYLYRVWIRRDAVIRPSYQLESSNIVGDVDRDEICPQPYNVTRYLNYFEDPGSLSLAIHPEVIAATQKLSLNDIDVDQTAVGEIVARLQAASKRPPLPEQYLRRIRIRSDRSPVSAEANSIVKEASAGMAFPLRQQLRVPAVTDDLGYEGWAHWLLGVRTLAVDPTSVLGVLDAKPVNVR